MIKMISTWNEKEYELPEFTDFLPIMEFAEKRFGMNFCNYKRTCADTRTVYNAMEFAIRAWRKLDKLDVLSDDDVHAKELMDNFIDNIPVSESDAMTECTNNVPAELYYESDWQEINKCFTKEAVYALFDCPILSDKQTDYYVNAWDEMFKSFHAAMDDFTTKKTETVTISVLKRSVAPIRKHPDKRVVKINFDTESIGLDPIYGNVGRVFISEDEITESKSNPKLCNVVLDANKTYSLSFGTSAENGRYLQMTGKTIAESNQTYVKAKQAAWVAARAKKHDTARIQQTENQNEKNNIVLLSLGKTGIKPVEMYSDRMQAVIGLRLERTIFGRIHFEANQLKDSMTNDKITYLPLSIDIKYPIRVRDATGKDYNLLLTGQEIVDANQAYAQEKWNR